jgi:DNA invertase Pin-like site-specific DNA recombinase
MKQSPDILALQDLLDTQCPLMLIGYARVSTDDQNLDLQRDALQQAGCDKIYTDRQSGASAERAGLTTALEVVRSGDTLVVWRLDRLGRSLKDLIRLVEQLEQRGVGLKSLQENIDTTTSGGRLVFHLFGALAEFERNLIRERTQAGLSAARARGRQGGRPKMLDAEKRQLALRLYHEREHSVAEICRLMGISKSTLYNYLAEAGADARHAA